MTFDASGKGNISSGAKLADEPLIREPPFDPSAATPNLATASAEGELSRDVAWRHARVSTAAYYIAQQRGFEPGSDGHDWVLAELQIDALDEAGAG